MSTTSRRSSRLALSIQTNYNNNKNQNDDDDMSPSSTVRKPVKRSKREVLQDAESAAAASSPSKKSRREGKGVLGFIRVDVSTLEEYPVKVGNVLGRTPKIKVPYAARHVPMNIKSKYLPKKFFEIMSVSTDKIEMMIASYNEEGETEQDRKKCMRMAKSFVTVLRNEKKLPLDFAQKIGLQAGDILKLHSTHDKDCTFSYQFQVAPMTAVLPSIKKQSTTKKLLSPGTYTPTMPMGLAVPNFKPPSLPPAKVVNKKKNKSPMKSNSRMHQVVDSDDDDEDDDEENRRRQDSMMHATLASTFWKALNTSTPHMSSTFLITLLKQNKLPTPDLLKQLVVLLTFGPTFQHDHPFYDGNRLQLALQYIEDLVKHDDMMPRLCLAAAQVADGGEYWRLVMDQLHVMPYVENRPKEPQVSKDTMNTLVDQSFQLHSFALQMLLLLLKHDKGDTIQNIRQNCKHVTRHIAQTMAYVWVERGHFLFLKEGAAAMEQVTRQLTQVLGLVVANNPSSIISETEVVDLLWNAMHGQFRQTQNADAKKLRKQLLLMWVCNLEDLAVEKAHNSVDWKKVVQSLSKRAKLGKEYTKLSSS